MTADDPGKKKPHVSKLGHVTIPVRDGMEAVRFWTNIFGGELRAHYPEENFFDLWLPGDIPMGFSQQPGGWTGPKAEYPHIGLDVEPDMMDPLKQRLTEFGIPTQKIWTRFRTEVYMFFRDPSGNLFELFCHEGYPNIDSVAVGSGYGGTYHPDVEMLNYDTWKDPGK